MKPKVIKIETITVQVGAKTLELSPQEARELRDELNKVVGGEVVRWYPYYQPHYWTQPCITPAIGVGSAGTFTATNLQFNNHNQVRVGDEWASLVAASNTMLLSNSVDPVFE